MERIDSADCTHPAFEPERYLGSLTSEYVCVRCGFSTSYEHAMLILESAEAESEKGRSVA
jgi:hypothetical protein